MDYTVTYSHNTDVGLATVTISGTGNYAGFVDVSFPIYAMSTDVLIGDEQTPQAVVYGLDALYGDKNVYTEEDQKIEQNGGSVNLALSVQTKSHTGDDQKKIQKLAQDKVIGLYLDISLYKTVTFPGELSGTKTKINQISAPLTITIPLPDEMKNRAGIALYRVHEGVATIIPIGKENAANGEYCIVDDEHITLYVSNFSTYAIGYDKAKDSSENTISNPDTSDDTPILPFIAFGICGFITITLFRKGKKPHPSL